MPWIRLDCALLYDSWVRSLTEGERLAWMCLLLHTKAVGGRGKVRYSSAQDLGQIWDIDASSVASMLARAVEAGKVRQLDGAWSIVNWSRYQDDHKSQNRDFPVLAESQPIGATTTPPHSKDKDSLHAQREVAKSGKEVLNLPYILRLHDSEFSGWVMEVRKLLAKEKFDWRPTGKDFEGDLKILAYRTHDEIKKRVLDNAYNSLEGEKNWFKFLDLCFRYMLTVRRDEPVNKPLSYVLWLVNNPRVVIDAKSEGRI